MKKRLLSLGLALVLALSSFALLPADDFTASARSQEEYILPVGGVVPFYTLNADGAVPEERAFWEEPLDNGSETQSGSLIRQTSSKYMYRCLSEYENGENMQKLYDDILSTLEEFWYSTATVRSKSKIFWFSNRDYGVTSDEAVLTATMVYDANPMLFFANKGIWSGLNEVGIQIKSDYFAPSTRAQWESEVSEYISSYESALNGKTTLYQKALALHDALVRRTEYAFYSGTDEDVSESWAHDITGAIEKNSVVCEGYSRAYELLVNYYGGDCSYAHGIGYTGDGSGNHAWNIVRLDNAKYYFVDATWDDPISNYSGAGGLLTHNYFAVGTKSFYKDHEHDEGFDTTTITNYPWNKHYIIPDVPIENYDPSAPVHVHSYTAQVISPSCTAKGYTLYTCRSCGDYYKADYTDMTEHKYGEWEIQYSAGCTSEGLMTRTCTVCQSDVQTKTIAATGHKWGEWKTATQPTAATDGEQVRTCSECGLTETRSVSKTGGTDKKDDSDKQDNTDMQETTSQRIAGANRFATAAEISKASFTKSDTVVLAYGLNYADALAGVTLANKLNAPILLTHTAKLPDETRAEIKRLGAKKVIILGGTGAISKDVENSLKKNGLTTERYAGTTRFGTATAIAEKLNDKPTDVFFVYAFNYADALSVSTVAALKNAPIIYLKTNGELDKDTADYLAKLKKAGSVKNVYVIGGEGVISKDMLNKAGKALGVTPTRVAGKNRYATCVEVNNKFKSVLTGTSVCVAKGLDFPDALAGGVFAAANKAPLFLADNTLKDEQKTYLKSKKADTFYVFGGTGAVPDGLVGEITKSSI